MCIGYPSLLEKHLGVIIKGNFAVGGQGIFEQKEIILQQEFKGIDLVILSVGVNDFSSGKPIGIIPPSTETEHDNTFIGAYCTALDHIFQCNPKIKAVLMTPLHRNTLHRTGNVPKSAIDTKINGNVLEDFSNAIIEIGRFYSCPVADMYANSGLNRFNLKDFTFEGVHPTNEGYEFIIGSLFDALQKV